MEYPLVAHLPAASLDDKSPEQLRAYFEWYKTAIPTRIKILEKSIQGSDGFEHWVSDLSEASLTDLGRWFEKETAADRTGSSTAIQREVPLSPILLSIVNDVGMYFGQTLIAEYPQLRWAQLLQDRRHITFGQPVIMGFGNVPLSPNTVMMTLAYGLRSGEQSAERLRQLFSYWSMRVTL